MEESAPVGIVKSTDQVAKDTESTDCGPSMIHHDFHMISPGEFVMDKDAKIADEIHLQDAIMTSERVSECNLGDD